MVKNRKKEVKKMKCMFVDYARVYRAAKQLGIRDALRVLLNYADSKDVTDIFFWAFSFGKSRMLTDQVTALQTDINLHVSEVPLEVISDVEPQVMVGNIDIAGTKNNATFKLQDKKDLVNFDSRIAYALGAATGHEGIDEVIVVSNSIELHPCLADVADGGISARVAFFMPVVGAKFYRVYSSFNNYKFDDLMKHVSKSGIRGRSIADYNFTKL